MTECRPIFLAMVFQLDFQSITSCKSPVRQCAQDYFSRMLQLSFYFIVESLCCLFVLLMMLSVICSKHVAVSVDGSAPRLQGQDSTCCKLKGDVPLLKQVLVVEKRWDLQKTICPEMRTTHQLHWATVCSDFGKSDPRLPNVST